MNRSILLGTVCLLFAAPGARAQSASSAASGQTPAPSAEQTQDQNPSIPSAASPAPQKKVWTNEDVGYLREDSTISTFQPKGKNTGNKNSAASTKSQKRDANWYRQQIENLQKQIPPIDAKIAELQKGMSGGTVNDPTTSSRPYTGVRAGSWQEQMNDLQSKRADIVAKISSLEDQARHAGVSTNEVP